ncbi:MAG: efflux transporter outer membrane subunit [Phycisphaeraceae bacterium]|nr:MAG: efflux transporter outer membrane subunit [Phycisphaeraceae bacterium]
MTSHVVRVPLSRGMRLVLARVGLAAVAGGVISGCMVGPSYERPSAAVNSAWEAIDGVQESPTVPDWWSSFNDPVLTSLIAEAHGQNLSLRVAGLRVIEARAARGVAVGEFFPQVQNAFGSVGADQLSRNEAGAAGDRVFSSDRIGLEAAWELDFWGKFRRGIEAADAGVLLAVANFDAVFVTLTAEVASNYVLIRSLQERLGFARANVELQKETLELTETRFRAGAVSELDVATARATLANTRALIPELELALRQTTLALGVLLGKTPSDLAASLATPQGEAIRVPDAPAQIAAGVPADLLRRRPDVRAAERLAAAQSARIGQAEADLYPSISIAGSTGFASSTFENGRGSDLGDIFDADSFTGFIGLSVNWPIFNYGRIRSNVRVQDARYEQAVTAYREVVLRAAADVEAGLAEFLRSRERTAHLSEAVDASNRSVELSLIQYRAGAVDFIRVNDAQTQLVAQQDNLVVSRASIALGAVRTYRALGGGWEVRGESEYVDGDTAMRMRERTNWGEVLDPSWQEGKDLGFPRPDAPGSTPVPHGGETKGGL